MSREYRRSLFRSIISSWSHMMSLSVCLVILVTMIQIPAPVFSRTFYYTRYSLLLGVRFQESQRKVNIREWQSAPPKNASVFAWFLSFLCGNIAMGAAFELSFSSLTIMRHSAKICSPCRTILMLLSVEDAEWCIYITGATLRICETTKQEAENSSVMQGHVSPLFHGYISVIT